MSRNIVSHLTNYRQDVCLRLDEPARGLKLNCIRVAIKSDNFITRDVAHESRKIDSSQTRFLEYDCKSLTGCIGVGRDVFIVMFLIHFCFSIK